jgi:ferredoxin
MSYAYPTLDVSMNRLRAMLAEYRQVETAPAHVVIHDELQCTNILEAIGDELPDSLLLFSIEEIGALGMPFWLSALAYGAATVSVWNAKSHDDHDWQELQQQLSLSQQMIAGMGYDQQRIQWLEATTPDAVKQALTQLTTAEFTVNDAANFAGIDDKRRVITMAMTHLHQHAPQQVEEIALPATAAFGQVNVDKAACTLCMSCVSVCPMGALVDGVDKPQLNFIEDLCVQCGMCETACPEDAISLQARYLLDRETTRQKRLLHEEAIFHCIRCAKPFATKKMIDMMTEKLKGHSLFQGAALDRLKMCEDCRVKAMFDDQQGTH